MPYVNDYICNFLCKKLDLGIKQIQRIIAKYFPKITGKLYLQQTLLDKKVVEEYAPNLIALKTEISTLSDFKTLESAAVLLAHSFQQVNEIFHIK